MNRQPIPDKKLLVFSLLAVYVQPGVRNEMGFVVVAAVDRMGRVTERAVELIADGVVGVVRQQFVVQLGLINRFTR